MLATTPEQIHRMFETAFNDNDLDGLMALYEPDAVLVPQPGSVARGTEEVREALQRYLALRGRQRLGRPRRRLTVAAQPSRGSPARRSMTRTTTLWSSSPKPFQQAAPKSWSTRAVSGSATPSARAAASAKPRSLCWNAAAPPGRKSPPRSFGPFTSSTRLPASPPASTANTRWASRPPLRASTSASDRAVMVAATTIWL